ncbi:MAG: zinc-ribbon domain-containing protein [Clostridia bacterium]|nr:zinc-ribbon domain-containing protein [Clostridia bacterium]
MKCMNCGNESVKENAKFCTVCGARIPAISPSAPAPSATVMPPSGTAQAPQNKSGKSVLIVLLSVLAAVLLLADGALVCFKFGVFQTEGSDNATQVIAQTSETTATVSASTTATSKAPTTTTAVQETTMPQPAIVPADKSCRQFVLVKASGSEAKLTYYEMTASGYWTEIFKTDARVGKNGITPNKTEGDGCTPAGEFELTFCCALTRPTTKLSYIPITYKSVWVDDVSSDYYNTLQNSDAAYKDWSSAEDMYNMYFANSTHSACINIASNGDGRTVGSAVAGRGSVITLCGKNTALEATHGCVDISSAEMTKLLARLDSAQHPCIIITG